METTKVLTKDEIQAALEERHSPEKQKKLTEGRVTIAGLGLTLIHISEPTSLGMNS